MTVSINYIISLYISIWASLAYQSVEQIPKPKYTKDREHSFVRYDLNRIEPTSLKSMSTFHRAVDELIAGKRQKINIVHIGDSHIQADFFSDQVRSHFNNEGLLGNGGRGYFFPCSMAKSNNPFNLKVSYSGSWIGCKNIQTSKDCTWGLGGMTARTADQTASFSIDPNSRSSSKYPITKVRVYYHVNDPKSFDVRIRSISGELIEPSVISAEGYAQFELEEAQNSVNFVLEKQYEDQNNFTLEGVSFSNAQKGVQYHAVGVNGATVYSFLKTPKLAQHLKSLNPDLIIMSLGTNDAYTDRFDGNQFKERFAKLLQRIRAVSPETAIVISTPGDCALPGGRWNMSNKVASQKIRELAEETNSAVWDLLNIMGGVGSINKWLSKGLCASDRVHMSGKGYRLQGDLLYDALIQDYVYYRLHQQEQERQNTVKDK